MLRLLFYDFHVIRREFCLTYSKRDVRKEKVERRFTVQPRLRLREPLEFSIALNLDVSQLSLHIRSFFIFRSFFTLSGFKYLKCHLRQMRQMRQIATITGPTNGRQMGPRQPYAI